MFVRLPVHGHTPLTSADALTASGLASSHFTPPRVGCEVVLGIARSKHSTQHASITCVQFDTKCTRARQPLVVSHSLRFIRQDSSDRPILLRIIQQRSPCDMCTVFMLRSASPQKVAPPLVRLGSPAAGACGWQLAIGWHRWRARVRKRRGCGEPYGEEAKGLMAAEALGVADGDLRDG